MAVILYADGRDVDMAPPANGNGYTLDEVYAAIGGGCDMVQQLPVARIEGEVLLMDEDAKLRNERPRHNKVATAMVVGLIPGDHIVGTVLHVALRDGEWVPLFKEGTSE